MKKKFWLPFLLLACLLANVKLAEAHPYHVSIAEVKYNAKTRNLEFAIKLFTDDLEKALSDLAKKPIAMEQSAEVNKLLKTYLFQNLALDHSDKKVSPVGLVGFERQDDTHWVYLEISVSPESLKTVKLRNQILIETFADQVNLVNLEINGQKRTLIFKEGDVLKPLL